MKKFVLILLLLALAVTGVFAQSNMTDADLRKELHAYIDAISGENLYALRSLLSLLAGQNSSSNRSELYEVLDSISERNIDALKPLLQALADPYYNAAAGINQPRGTAGAAPSSSRVSAPVNSDEGVSKGLLSIGGGALFDWSLNNSMTISMPMYKFNLMSFGAFAFFDAKYVELSVGPSFGISKYVDAYGRSLDLKLLMLDVNLLGKIPIELSGGQISVFPLLGLSYNHILFGISGTSGMDLSKFGQLGALGGVGLDYYLSNSLYFRGEGLFHFRLPLWSAIIDAIGAAGNMRINFGMGPRVKLGVGYRF